MKTYKKVKVEAVNTPSGAYAAGCPANFGGRDNWPRCQDCERTY